MTPNYARTRNACYFSYLSMSSVFCVPALLFVTFREMYGISYTLLGTLVLINFCTQLMVDLIFTFFTRYFNVKKTVRIMPVITTVGMLIYAVFPMLFPEHAYIGLVFGTFVFSVAAGLSEVLLSPVVAAIPSEHPERDMSRLHSLYGWGVVIMVLITTIFLNAFGPRNWMYLVMFLAVLPLIACFLFCTSPMPPVEVSHSETAAGAKRRTMGLAMCVACIFLGSAAENVMTNWVSGFVENALHMSKAFGDIVGMAMFAILLGIVRTTHAKRGGNTYKILLFGMIGAVVCYLTAGLSNNAVVALLACALTGLCTSMLWPGSLIFMEEQMPSPGIAAYALMAAGGDFGASIAPQMMGVIVDKVAASDWAARLSQAFTLTAEQIGMKTGMLITAVFPLLGVFLLIYMKRYFSRIQTS